jgi:peptidyl-dipeptidase Dcp
MTMTHKLRIYLLAVSIFALLGGLAGCGERAEQPVAQQTPAQPAQAPAAEAAPVVAENPFFAAWDTPYGIPPFDRIRDEHFKPAFDRGIEELRAEIAAIRDNPEQPTFENTVEALELAGASLRRVADTFANITNTDTNDFLKELEVEINPILTRERDAIYLDEKIFARMNAVYEQREALGLDAQALRLLDLTHLDFVRQGAALDAAGRERMKEINARLSELMTVFGQNLLNETNSFELVVTDEADLAGLPDNMIGSASAKGEAKGKENAWVFGLDRGTFEGFMTFADNRELRKQMYAAYRARGGQGGDMDNRDELSEIAHLRAEAAKLLGYENHAAYMLETNMAKTPETAENFLLEVWKPALERAEQELAEMQQIVTAEGHDFLIEGHDWWYYAEKLRQQKYALNEAALKPYFDLANVRQGAFYVAERLFGVQFEPISGAPVWNPVVQTYKVTGPEGELLGIYMTDDYARESKRGGAWMSVYRDASGIRGDNIRPIVTNNLNVAVPAEGEPTLLTYDQVETVFHEFGHALHGLMTQVRYPRFSGTSGSPRDWVELPSQFMEHYATEPEVLAVYAKHTETGEVIPQELVDKVRAASTHNQGFKTTEYIAASLLDMKWHELTPKQAAAVEDVVKYEDEVLTAYGKPPMIETRYRSPYFAHIFAGGYSAGYYAYLWSEILDADGFTAFKETGDIFNPELARRLKENVYQAGASQDPAELYRQFRGQDPTIEPLLKIRGLN